MNGLILLGELAILFIFSNVMTRKLYLFFFLLFRGSRSLAISFTTLILFPGTIIHELAHLFTAEVLGVRTGKLTLVPEEIQDTEQIQSGYVMIAQTDPFRRAIIGTAPTIVGIIIITAISYWFPFLWQMATATLYSMPIWQNSYFWLLGLSGYLLVIIAASMFPSSVDWKGTPSLLIALGIILAGAYYVGFRLSLTGAALAIIDKIIVSLAQSLGAVLVIDISLLLILHLLIKFTTLVHPPPAAH